MSLLQKYRKEETRKTTPEEEKGLQVEPTIIEKKPLPPKEIPEKKIKKDDPKIIGMRSRPVISATVSLELVDALNDLTDEKYLNRSKFIEDALKRTIKTEFPDIAKRYGF
ncbi:MAG: hypothetical protein JXA54_03725 [Candidatus Heimdallarchaeota archaeon]|nr:hypothetical protein [Candidatus Heimdallarchaeota archaeon]